MESINVWLKIFALAFIQSHLTLLLGKGEIFKWCRRWKPVASLLDCPMCVGFWTAAIGSLAAPWWFGWLLVAALGHVLYLAREKWLPCADCVKYPLDEVEVR